MTLRCHTAGAHLANRLGNDYRVIACALGEATHHDIPEPSSPIVEGALHHGLPPENHLLATDPPAAARVTQYPELQYVPIDDTFLSQVDQVLFLRTIMPSGTAPSERGDPSRSVGRRHRPTAG